MLTRNPTRQHFSQRSVRLSTARACAFAAARASFFVRYDRCRSHSPYDQCCDSLIGQPNCCASTPCRVLATCVERVYGAVRVRGDPIYTKLTGPTARAACLPARGRYPDRRIVRDRYRLRRVVSWSATNPGHVSRRPLLRTRHGTPSETATCDGGTDHGSAGRAPAAKADD